MGGIANVVSGSGGGGSGSSLPNSVQYFNGVAVNNVGLNGAITGPTSWIFKVEIGTASSGISADTPLYGCVSMRAGGVLVAKYSDGTDACTYTVDGGWLAADELIIVLYTTGDTIQLGIILSGAYSWGAIESLRHPSELLFNGGRSLPSGVEGIIRCKGLPSAGTLLKLPINAFASWAVWTEPMIADKPQPAYNPLTKSTSISLKGAKNEWVGFLVCVRGTEDLAGFTPSVTATLTSGSNTIADKNLIPYILFNHTTTERANAYEVPGTYPDAAVPYRDVYYNEVRNGTKAGWGQTVAANTTRVFFIEIYIPSATVAGTYTGTFSLSSNNGTLTQDIPIELDVWNFTLPEQWSLKNLWGVHGYYTELDFTAFGARNDDKAREYIFNMQKAAINHGFFLYGSTGRGVSGPSEDDNFSGQYFDGVSDTYSWKRFLDGTVPQKYNPKPYPKTSIWGTRTNDGIPLINKSTTTMDAWASWILSHNYNQTTLFFDKIIDEPDLTTINAKHDGHVTRHSGYPERPLEYWTAGPGSYPKDSAFWSDNFKSVWMVSQFYTWYRAHNWGSAYGSPDDFDSRRATYGDLLFSYTAGDNDSDCNISTYDPSLKIRAAASSALDAYSRQNAYMFISDWHFKTIGHHFWITNIGWGYPLNTDNANNVWTTTDPFADTNGRTGYNGDGVYFYPGRVSGTNYDIGGTHEIPIESYKLKLVRWGAQVYEYAKLLEGQGEKVTANALINRMITFNVPNTITINSVQEWEDARNIMGEAIGSPD